MGGSRNFIKEKLIRLTAYSVLLKEILFIRMNIHSSTV